MAVCGVTEEEIKRPNAAEASGSSVGQSSQDSAIHLSTTDGSSASASPWPSPVHSTRKAEEDGEGIYLRSVHFELNRKGINISEKYAISHFGGKEKMTF